ncbi:hypothetical protein CPB85DRAFT_1324277 [Mucidula mucida]|nr:hypothetical protein CPB85DRAFT_1324277 [Mucidula mucida]
MSAIAHVKADLFTTPPLGSILIHACNSVGSWGAGIAVGFRENFPDAFVVYSKINSGKFGVPWEETEAVLQEIGVTMTIYEPIVPPT